MKKKLFYILSFTWGLPMTLIGLISACVLFCIGYRPTRYGYCIHFTVGKNWGGLNLGIFIFTDEKTSEVTKAHEHGHALQNCLYGFLMPFIVAIPSAIRYWHREMKYYAKGKNPPTEYDSVWFEGQATKWGTNFINNIYPRL